MAYGKKYEGACEVEHSPYVESIKTSNPDTKKSYENQRKIVDAKVTEVKIKLFPK